MCGAAYHVGPLWGWGVLGHVCRGLLLQSFSIQNTIPCIDEPLFTQSTAKLHAFQAGFELAWLLLSRRAGAADRGVPRFC